MPAIDGGFDPLTDDLEDEDDFPTPLDDDYPF